MIVRPWMAVPALLRPPGRGTCAGVCAVRAALDKGWGGAADLASAPGRGVIENKH